MNNTIPFNQPQPKMTKKELDNIEVDNGDNVDKAAVIKLLADKFLKQNRILTIKGVSYLMNENNIWAPISFKSLKDKTINMHCTHDFSKQRAEIAERVVALSHIEEDSFPGWNIGLKPEEVVFKNKIVNIFTNESKDIDPEQYITTHIHRNFNPEAKCPTWIKCLDDWLEGKEKSRLLLQEYFGYIICNRMHFRSALLLIGPKRCGKSKISEVAIALVGMAGCSAVDPAELDRDKHARGSLFGKQLNAPDEIDKNSKLGKGFRSAISGGLIRGKLLWLDDISFKPTCKHIFTANEMPVAWGVGETQDANMDRLLIIKFSKQFIGKSDDKLLIENLIKEIDGITNWAIEGLKRLLHNQQFTENTDEEVIILKKNYEEESRSELYNFIHSSGKFEFDEKYHISKDQLCLMFWESLGYSEKNFPQRLDKGKIGKEMKNSLKFLPSKTGTTYTYKGLRIKKEEQSKEIEFIKHPELQEKF